MDSFARLMGHGGSEDYDDDLQLALALSASLADVEGAFNQQPRACTTAGPVETDLHFDADEYPAETEAVFDYADELALQYYETKAERYFAHCGRRSSWRRKYERVDRVDAVTLVVALEMLNDPRNATDGEGEAETETEDKVEAPGGNDSSCGVFSPFLDASEFQTTFTDVARAHFRQQPHEVEKIEPAPINRALLERFIASSRRMKVLPSVVSHGTSLRKFNSIFDRGLIIPGRAGVNVANGSVYGRGIYTSTELSTPLAYSRCATAKTSTRVIVCGLLDPVVKPTEVCARVPGLVGSVQPPRTHAPPLTDSASASLLEGAKLRKELRRMAAHEARHISPHARRRDANSHSSVNLAPARSAANARSRIRRVNGSWRVIFDERLVLPLAIAHIKRPAPYRYTPVPSGRTGRGRRAVVDIRHRLDSAVKAIIDPQSPNRKPVKLDQPELDSGVAIIRSRRRRQADRQLVRLRADAAAAPLMGAAA
ncbi:uncharacterized protein AMSG_00949 [Thecamonas trahens ATCC 50062]|uniref:PARP catalytic domain-containing protein n=1 Tax=Thecamonas trahens ATCC 50062 TaxID=461836 RepID=A0A0L0DIL2_THETB|nr:hypothetical protein AMSG_00949 [Thecamonas trahens ATCC 50062]KNC52122.1 hypothetical protein AMSG_00949 [Thecamonas trahens ATCC 50062]|eukprot:XP_013762126.1 hypothetical protein AMSG_00949 [Thecamonas trahens ATCC 50062]